MEQHLSPKARQLLHLLVLNRSRAMSRQELYDELWPQTFVCETNLATVVSELRHALGDGQSAQYVRTVRGFGYAFCGEVSTVRPKPIARGILLCEDQRYLLNDGETSVGRSQECDIVLHGATISRHHAVIIIAGGDITLEDLRSRNGTYVNGSRISRAVVRDRETIAFGAVPASIIRRISSTLPFHLPLQRKHSGPQHLA
ncbi:MAG TPA: FHA domain-containing protein [Thermoanaerobaculia bacterium]|nr:FHA domain-containing protein [Thermoanaerobaculia bacterium]